MAAPAYEGVPQALVMRWSAAAWEMAAAPMPVGATSVGLSAIALVGAGGFWAVGSYVQPDSTYSKTLIERCG